MPALGFCKVTLSTLSKMVEIPNGHVNSEFIVAEAFPNIYLNQPITKGQCGPVTCHVLYPTVIPTATWLGLCSSLGKWPVSWLCLVGGCKWRLCDWSQSKGLYTGQIMFVGQGIWCGALLISRDGFHPGTHKRHHIARPWGRAMWCL